MSGIVVIFHRDGSQPSPTALDAVMARLAHHGPDGSQQWMQGPVAMGHQHFWTLPEDVDTTQPLTLNGRHHIVFDGRLDNRDDLIRRLQIDKERARTLPDAALVLDAYQKWGDACCEQLLGGFAFALYDADTRELLLARDAIGERTLSYYLDDYLLIAATEPYAVLAHPAVDGALNETSLIRWYAVRMPHSGQTFFEKVREVKPSHALSINPTQVREWAHWQLDVEHRIRYRHEEEYAEHFLHLLRESVKRRLRATTSIGVSLSGGYDSSSVTALAAEELAPEQLVSLSWTFNELPNCDESPAIRAMVNHFDLEHVNVPADNLWPLKNWQTWLHNPSMPEGNAYRLMTIRLQQAAADRGIRVLLDGYFGNHLFGPGGYWLVDLLSEGRLGAAARGLYQQLRHKGTDAARASVYRVISWMLDTLPGGRVVRPRRAFQPPDWLLPDAQQRLQQDMLAEKWPPGAGQSKRPDLHELILGTYATQGHGVRIALNTQVGLESRSPYHDPDLIAFAFAIPAYIHYNGWQSKRILYQAMDGIWPEAVRKKPSYGPLTTMYLRGFSRERAVIQQLLERPGALWRQYVTDHGAYDLPDDPSRGRVHLVPWFCLAVEMWRHHPAYSATPSQQKLVTL